MDETIVNRLLILMEAYGFSAGAFADKIEVQRSSISHLMSGRNKPSLDFIQKVLLQFPDINPSWLIMGKGPMKQLNLFDEVGKVAEPVPLPPTVAVPFETPSEPVKAEVKATTEEAKITTTPEPETKVQAPALEEKSVVAPSIPAPLTTPIPPAPVTASEVHAPVAPASPEVVASTPQVNTTPSSIPHTQTKKVLKIVFFYDDNTFETFHPGN